MGNLEHTFLDPKEDNEIYVQNRLTWVEAKSNF